MSLRSVRADLRVDGGQGEADEACQGPRDLHEMMPKLAERKWAHGDFVQWWNYTPASFPGSVWKSTEYTLIRQLGWSFEPMGSKGCGFYFAPPSDAETIAMLSKLSLSTFIPASSFGGRKESYAFKGIALWQRFAWAAGATHERLAADSVCALVPLEIIGKVADYVPALGCLDVYRRWRDEQSGRRGASAETDGGLLATQLKDLSSGYMSSGNVEEGIPPRGSADRDRGAS